MGDITIFGQNSLNLNFDLPKCRRGSKLHGEGAIIGVRYVSKVLKPSKPWRNVLLIKPT